jgi:tRNA(Arg) A34 adenosine deaminase TadA
MSDIPEADLQKFMGEAIDLAKRAKEHGNHPFGALLVVNGRVALTSENTVITGKNSSHHAESNLMNVIAASGLSPEEIASATLYTSTEPCAMCSGAIYWGGIKKVVYGCPSEVLGEIAGDDFCIPSREIFKVAKKAPVTVVGPVMLKEAESVHIGFWDCYKGHYEKL